MTPIEKLTLETSVSLVNTAASLLSQDSALLNLLAEHLPNLTEEQRVQLRSDSTLRLELARKQTENAKLLASVLERQQ